MPSKRTRPTFTLQLFLDSPFVLSKISLFLVHVSFLSPNWVFHSGQEGKFLSGQSKVQEKLGGVAQKR